jgi:hypothetical protein
MAVRGVWKLATVLAGGFSCFAQAPAPRCVLAGTVINSATNAGIAHALVSFFGAAQGYRFTDTAGNFQVPNVPCQGYSLNVSKPGFVSSQEDPTSPFLLSNPILREAQENESDQPGAPPKPANVTVNLTPDSEPERIPLIPVASIAGTVLDENGEPLAGVVAQAVAVKATLSGTDYIPAKTAHTDDRGHYALLGLAPGDYVVRLAGESSSTRYFQGPNPNPNNDHRGMQPAYYSNADTLASATVLHLAPAVQANADFRQATEAAFDIDGRLSGLIPQAWARLRLYRDGDRLPLGRAFVNLTSGQFRLTDVPRGSYTLRVEQYQADPVLWLAAEEPVPVTAEPIRNLVVPLSGAVDIPVSVSYEEGAKEEGVIQLMLQPRHSPENMRNLAIGTFAYSGRPITDAAEGVGKRVPASSQPKTFTNVIPDRYKLTVQASGGWGYVASAKLGNMDVLHGDFAIGGSVPGELHVTVRGDGATVEGRVTFQGQPALGAQVYLIPTADNAAGLNFAFSDPEGHYHIAGVPPGEYRIRAWTGPPTSKEVLAGAGETLTLQASEQRTVTLEAIAVERK